MPVMTVFLIVDTAFFASNLFKVPSGGWFPLVLAAILILQMTIWRRGRILVEENEDKNHILLKDFIAKVQEEKPHRMPGAGIYLMAQRSSFDIDDDFHKFFNADYGDCFNIKNIQSYSAFAGIKRVDSSKNIAHNLRCGDHITIDHIEESYRRGSLLKYSVPELVLCSNFDFEDHETAPPETVIAIKPENYKAIRKAINVYIN